MAADKEYCMSHYLAFRFVENENKDFFENVIHRTVKPQKIPKRNLSERLMILSGLLRKK